MSLRIQVAKKLLKSDKPDLTVRLFGKNLPEAISEKLTERGFKDAWGAAEFLAGSNFVGVVSLGKEEDENKRAEGLRRGLAKIVTEAQRQSVKHMLVDLRGVNGVVGLAKAAVEALLLTSYVFAEHKKTLAQQQRQRGLKAATILVDSVELVGVQRAVQEVTKVMAGVDLARYLVNQPASHMKPSVLMEVALGIAKQKNISLEIMDRADAAQDGWRAFLAVAAGSTEEPYVLHLTYTPTQPAKRKIVVVGKGITFDSGGLSLKPAEFMEDMKIDMAGAAVVLGLFSVLPKLNLPFEVHGIVATCENMPSGSAYRPGDILHSRSGKTIEVMNTDAEGRVTLADALDFAQELTPDAIIDLATLTGAVMVALGETYAGLFSNNKELNDALMKAAKVAGEGLEDLPLPEEYKQHVESKVADLTNAPANHPFGGAITAALFLQEFVGKTAWAHIDLAGPSYIAKPLISYWTGGATGYGVRTLVEFLKKF